MSKRGRRPSSTAEGEDESDSAPEMPLPTQRKRRRLDPSEVCQHLYDTLRCYKKEDGSLLCDAFIRAPKRRQEPQYYQVVTQPIDLLRVQQKLKTDSYEDVEELAADVELLVNNAKAFYKPDSSEYRDAESLWSLFLQSRQNINTSISEEVAARSRISRLACSSRKSTASLESAQTAEGELSSTSTNNDEEEIFEEYFVSVMSATVEGRPLHPAFLSLPSKKTYPEYYEVIKSPLDLREVAGRVHQGDYSSLQHMERDLLLITRNACAFNEPGSQIYKDAKALKKHIQAKRVELEHGRSQTPAKTSERIRSKKTTRPHAPLAYTSAAVSGAIKVPPETPDSDQEKGDGDSDAECGLQDSPQWKLLETIKDYPGANGMPMSEPFWKLPSRRFYSDYYKEIKNPVSLWQIKVKIKRGDYGTLSEVAGDMNIMFENAKQYNVHTSRLYKDAVRLQRLMQTRVQELLDIVRDSSSDDESLSSVKSSVARGRGRPRLNPLPSTPPGRPAAPVVPLRKRLHGLQRHLLEYTCSDGRQPMLLFMEKPSKKLYPDYYNVIDRPIDMLTIESNIKNERYTSLDQIVADFKVMFANCRQYNEEGSMIYEDANLLEKALNDKLKEWKISSTGGNVPKTPKPVRAKQLSPAEQKLRTLYDAIRDYRDPKAKRQLALIFMKLPNKLEYPDYYELIKIPIDMERIAQKLKLGSYATVAELAGDFVLMFDNACKYNEPDSQIYKDALVLQRVCLQTKQMLREDDEAVPDVAAAVQELLMNLFTTVYNHQDEEGRCFSDSMFELPEHDEGEGGKVRAVSLDLIKRRLDRGLYKRLDHFQEDMFAVWDRSRNLTRTDSQVFEDAVELQLFYLQARDELCRGVLDSPALRVGREQVLQQIELVKQCKMLQEQEHTEEDNERSSSCDESIPVGSQPLTAGQFAAGDFIYVAAKKGNPEPSILQIQKLWTSAEEVPMLLGNCYFRPSETFHVTTRRFLEQEVFKTETNMTVPLDQVIGKCYVMSVKDYFKNKPEGFAEKDVYVCESRYSTRSRSFKKIKVWGGEAQEVRLLPREAPLEPRRVMSVFRERLEKHRDELAELQVLEDVQEKERPNVVMFTPPGSDEENTHYEQYTTVCSGVIKIGDFVYVVTDGGKQMVAQVDTIWETKDGKCYFRGPWLVFPSEVVGSINKVFYKQEVLLTAVHDSNPLVGIVGKCGVLHYDEYLKCRPTEIPEADVYVCEAFYDEAERTSRKLKDGLRKYNHTEAVTTDEVYWFGRTSGPPPLANQQDSVSQGLQPHVMRASSSHMDVKLELKCEEAELLLDSSLDESLASPATPLGVGAGPGAPVPSLQSSGTPHSLTPQPTPTKRKKDGKKLVTGYILYSSDVRKNISANHPESSFGEISRIVGNEWRSLSSATKQSWEERAAKCNEETTAKMADGKSLSDRSLPDFVYECLWDTCDFQFEDFGDCMEHCIGEGTGHVQQMYAGSKGAGAFQCVWRGCSRMKRPATAPFPNMPRLQRHVRDLHINKGNGKNVPIGERSKNFVASRNKARPSVVQHRPTPAAQHPQTVSLSQLSPLSRGTPSPGLGSSAVSGAPPVARGAEPLFVSVPPRPHRVQHSEAYIRYIEGLHSEQKYMSPWEKTLTAPAPVYTEGVPAPAWQTRLPLHWLGAEAEPQQEGPHILKALGKLRDLLLQDATNIHSLIH